MGERNFNIFYQLATDSELKSKLKLDEIKSYKFINHSDCIEVSGINDAEEFENTKVTILIHLNIYINRELLKF